MPNPVPVQLTLADVREHVSRDVNLPPIQRSHIRSSIKRLGELLGTDLAILPAEPGELRERIATLHPAQVGLSRNRLHSIRADLMLALERVGVPVLRTSRTQLSPPWRTLYDALPSVRLKIRLSRFFRFCVQQGLDPDDVDDTTSESFRTALVRFSLVPNPRVVHRDFCRGWNRAANTVAGWPQRQLTESHVSDRNRSLLWESVPASFKDDADRCLAWLGGDTQYRDTPPRIILQPASRKRMRHHFGALLMGLAKRGYDLEQFRSLSDLLAPEYVKEALRHRLDQRDGTPAQYERSIAYTVQRIARDWVRVDEHCLDELRRIGHQLGPQHQGLADKNRAALRQFASDHNIRLILELPDRLMRDAIRKDRGDVRAAVTAQKAVAIELLLSAPMYIGNLVRLNSDTHLRRTNGLFEVAIGGDDVRIRRVSCFALSHHASGLLNTYLGQFHARLVRGQISWLFPGASGAHKAENTLSAQIRETVYERTGLRLTPHQFRHLAAKIILDVEHDAYEVVRQLLGHKRYSTTETLYRSMDMDNALRHYDRLLTSPSDTSTLD